MTQICALLRSRTVDDPHGLIKRAEAPVVCGIILGYKPEIVAAAYATTVTDVMVCAKRFLYDLAAEKQIHLEHCECVPDQVHFQLQARQLVNAFAAREGGQPPYFVELLSSREQAECRAVLPLFDVYTRVANRLKELNHGNIQTATCP